MAGMSKRVIDPLITLPIPDWSPIPQGSNFSPSSITSLCFLNEPSSIDGPLPGDLSRSTDFDDDNLLHDFGNDDDASDSDSSSDDDEGENTCTLRCSQILRGYDHDGNVIPAAGARAASSECLRGCHIVTCNVKGDTRIWDLGQRKVVSNFLDNNDRGQGLLLRRVSDVGNQILYQTRDPRGIVSLHENDGKCVSQFETKSRTFCTAAPCWGNPNLVALPSEDDSQAVVRDWRLSASNPPVITFLASSDTSIANDYTFDHSSEWSTNPEEKKHGMLTSLGFTTSSTSFVVACGMESGSIFFHDLAMPNRPVNTIKSSKTKLLLRSSCSIDFCNPVLSLDLRPSSVPIPCSMLESVVAVAGTAGDASDLAEKAPHERGTVVIVKATRRIHADNGLDSNISTESHSVANVDHSAEQFEARRRARFATCNIDSDKDDVTSGGKPGVSICRLQPDGRLLAVGGWDNRVRIFDRSCRGKNAKSGALKAILRGHTSSVNAIDWSPMNSSVKLIATAGASDSKMYAWRC